MTLPFGQVDDPQAGDPPPPPRPIERLSSPLRSTCWICGDEIQPCTIRLRIRLRQHLPGKWKTDAHDDCFIRALQDALGIEL